MSKYVLWVTFLVFSLGTNLFVSGNGLAQESATPAVSTPAVVQPTPTTPEQTPATPVPTPSPTEQPSIPAPTTPATPTEIKEIKLWHYWSEDKPRDVLATLILQFEQEHPGVKVKTEELYWSSGHEKIVSAFEAGTAPDVLELGSDMIPEFSMKGVILDITKDISPIWNTYRGRGPVIYDRKIFGLPWVLDSRAVYCNCNLMKRAGLDPNKLPETWDELKKSAEKINRIGGEIYGIGVNSSDRNVLYKKMLPFMWSNGGQVLSEDGKLCLLDSKENREAINYYLSLRSCGLVGRQKELDQAFKDGKLGFWISGSWLVPRIKQDNPRLDFKVTLIPQPGKNKGTRTSFAGGEYLVINKETKCAKECIELIKFLTNESNSLFFTQILEKFTPGVRIPFSDKYYETRPEEKAFAQQLEQSIGSPGHQRWIYIKDIFEDELGLAIENKKSGAKALKDASQRIDELLSMER